MKLRRKDTRTMATREFTDREEPRAAFWSKYNTFKNEMLDGNVAVLTYYGIGGIGKSHLLKKLRQEMDEKLKTPLYVDFSFEVAQESRAVLEALRNILKTKHKFAFSLFDIGVYAYGRKIGLDSKLPEVKAFIDSSPVLGIVTSVLDVLSIAGLATKTLSIADKTVALVRNHLIKHSRELHDIEQMDAADLYNYLPYLFACDVESNLEKKSEPLVIFLDTYEMLVNEFSAKGDTLDRDLWLRGDYGLVRNTPNTLWVIAGREKLKWEQFDPEWSEALEQHIVGNLSESDGVKFLKKAGVLPESLCSELYSLTHGTPVYLDFCVERYTDLVENGETPTIGHFGKDVRQLVSRFAQYMDDSKRDFVYMLAHLGTWDDAMIEAIAPDVISSFSDTTYERIKGFSFVNRLSDGRYSIHQTVGEILLADASDSVRIIGEKTAAAIMPYCDQKTDEIDPSLPEYLIYLQYMRKFGEMEESTLYAEMLYASSVAAQGRLLEAIPLSDTVYGKFKSVLGEKHPDTVTALSMLFGALGNAGRLAEAAELSETLIPLANEILGEDTPEAVTVMLQAVAIRCSLGNYEEALHLGETVYERSKAVLGESDRLTLMLLNSLSIAHNCLGNNERSLEINTEAYNKAKAIGDEEAMYTSKHSSVNSLYNMGRFKEALTYSSEAVALAERLYGKEHPNTYMSLSNVARAKYALGEFSEALKMYEQLVAVFDREFGSDSLITLIIYNQMADVLESLGDKKRALELNKTLLPAFIEAAGEDHSSTQKVMLDIARLSE